MIEKLEEFLRKYYEEELFTAAREGKDSIEVDYNKLDKFDYELAEALLNNPNEFFSNGKEAIKEIDLPSEEESRIALRVKNLPESEKERIKDLRSKHLGKFIKIEGTVRRASEVKPELEVAIFECPDCGEKIKVPQIRKRMSYPSSCNCGRKRGFKQVGRTLNDSRWVVLEDLFEEVSGEKPGEISVYLKNDLTVPKMQRKTDPGARLEISGIVREMPKRVRGKKTKKLEIFMEANYIKSKEVEFEELEISEEDENKIKELASNEDIYRKLQNSLAPSMHGMDEIKESIALQLFGGVPHKLPDGTQIRGDIHLLLVGDPGTGKTQLMKLVSDLIPRGRYVSGKGTSLDFKEPIIIRKNGEIKILKIGKLVDKYINSKGAGKSLINEEIEALSLNLKTYELEWKPITHVLRHKADDLLYKFELQSGREVTVTGDHSIYTFENGTPTLKKASEINKDNLVLIPSKIPNNGVKQMSSDMSRLIGYYIADGYLSKNEEHYDHKVGFAFNRDENILIDDLVNISHSKFDGYDPQIYYRDGKAEIMFRTKEIFNSIRNLLGNVAFKHAKNKRIPLRFFNTLSQSRREFIKGYLKGDAGVTRSRELMSDLLYIYLLEGIIASCCKQNEKGKVVTFPDGHRTKLNGWRFQLKGPDYDQPFVTRDIYKHPYFESLDSTAKEYLLQKTDYSRERVKKSNLKKDTLWLKRLKDLETEDLKKGKASRELASKWGVSRRIACQWLRKYAKRNFVKIEETDYPINKILERDRKGRIKKCKHYPRQIYSLTEKGEKILKSWENLRKIFKGDMGFAKVKKITRTNPTSEFVYDVSVKDNENFVGGFGGVICHNSAAGLTASVVRDEEFMGGWVLEAGALVLSNKSLLAIDEFDKMSKEDQVNLHEAMSTQTVSISKASIQATLPARTSIIGGANPKLSRFDPYRPINEQIDIPQTIISRFDIRFALRDVPDKENDEKLVDHVIKGRISEEDVEPEIDSEILKKYIAYARKNIKPEMTKKAASVLKNFYINLRNKYTGEESQTIPLSLRQYEALMRLSEASAKVKLKNKVTEEDAQRAIKLMKYSLRQLGMDPETGRIDIDRAEGGTPSSQRSKIRIVMDVLDELEKELGKNVPIEDVIAALEEEGLSNADKILREMKQKGMVFEPRPGYVQKI